MNKIAVSFVSGIVGGLIGAVSCYIFLKKKFESQYYEEVKKAIDEECNRLRANHKEAGGIDEAPVQTEESKDQNSYEQAIHWLSDDQIEVVDEGVKDDPHFIDEDEFRFLPPRYEVRELQYILGNGTILDINDEIVPDSFIYIKGLEDEIKKLRRYETVYILVESIGVAVEMVAI